jgi:hypothetical protein
MENKNLTHEQFQSSYRKKKLKGPFQNIFDKTLITVDFSDVTCLRHNIDNENRGIYHFKNGKWEWAAANTFNTNYSCIFLVIDYINNNKEKKITVSDFDDDNIVDTLNYFESVLSGDKQTIFCPGSEIYDEMFFTSQRTWNKGIISTISLMLTFIEHYGEQEHKDTYKRGIIDDLCGIDMVLNIFGKKFRNQHKKTDISWDSNYYYSDGFLYNELTYRKNLDSLTIQQGTQIYFLKNSKSHELIKLENGTLKIHKNLLIKIMDIENSVVTGFLTTINEICYNEKIAFSFEIDETKKNTYEISSDGKNVILYLNNYGDEKLVTKLRELIKELQQLPN